MSTRFPIVRLKPLGHSSPILNFQGSGIDLASLGHLLFLGRSEPNPLCDLLRRSRGLELQEPNRSSFNGGSGIRTHAVLPPTP